MEEKPVGKSVKLNCDFCGKEIECPEDMLNAEKHSCFECFDKHAEKMTQEDVMKLHVDIPRDKFDTITDTYMISTVMEAFSEFWKDKKEDIKAMSRRDAIFYAFGSGATTMLDLVKHMDEEAEKLVKDKTNKTT